MIRVCLSLNFRLRRDLVDTRPAIFRSPFCQGKNIKTCKINFDYKKEGRI
jgi:hypothetical protein